MKKKTEQKKQPAGELPPATLRRFLHKNYVEKGVTLYPVGRVTLFPSVMPALRAGNPGPLCELLSQTGPRCLAHADIMFCFACQYRWAPRSKVAMRLRTMAL
jgi:hypothetical protein